MANTAYERASRDLTRSGLNRILALGKPAATPAGNVAQIGNPAGEAVNTALAVKQARQQREVMIAQRDREESTTELNRVNAERSRAAWDLIEEQTRNESEKTVGQQLNNEILERQSAQAQIEQAIIETTLGEALVGMGLASKSLPPVLAAIVAKVGKGKGKPTTKPDKPKPVPKSSGPTPKPPVSSAAPITQSQNPISRPNITFDKKAAHEAIKRGAAAGNARRRNTK